MEKATQYIAIIILNYNNWEDTVNCIESVEKYNTAPIKYIVVDNGSDRNGTIDELDKYFQTRFTDQYDRIEEGNQLTRAHLSHMTFVVSKTNDGYAQGNNKGLNIAYADDEIGYIMILNNDILFVEDIIPSLVILQQKIKDCAIISPTLYKKDLKSIDYNCARKDHTEWELILTYLFLYKDICGRLSRYREQRFLVKHNPSLINQHFFEIELPSGSCMLINKTLMLEIGAFDPNTFLYFEENILYKKIQKLGMKNYLVPSLRCIHLGASSTSKSSSAFMLQTSFHSCIYYIQTYCHLNRIQHFLWSLAMLLFPIKVKLVRMFKG